MDNRVNNLRWRVSLFAISSSRINLDHLREVNSVPKHPLYSIRVRRPAVSRELKFTFRGTAKFQHEVSVSRDVRLPRCHAKTNLEFLSSATNV